MGSNLEFSTFSYHTVISLISFFLQEYTTSTSLDWEAVSRADPEEGTGGPDPPWNFGKKVVIRFVIGTGLILHSIYVNYSHKSKKGSKCGDLMVRT